MRKRCGECEPCKREDCGTCRHCVRFIKFGGPGDCKSACLNRHCLNMKPSGKEKMEVVAAPANGRGSKRKQPSSPQSPPKRKARFQTPSHMYGVAISDLKVKAVCAECMGRKNQELANEPIVLCDGKDCGREFHLSCCLPPLSIDEVPEGSYLCIDCDPDGTSSKLESYFVNTAASRADFDTSRAYVQSLFQSHPVPVSELARISDLHHDATASSSSPREPIQPDFLIGKPLRLYCPEGNSYHDGRIIDWRRATHLRPISSSAPPFEQDFLFGDITELARCEFLVSFPAGLDYRKRTVMQWIVLEEHSLAVGTSLIRGYHTSGRKWLPGITWLRTSLELIPVLELLSEADGQIYWLNKKGAVTHPSKKTWALVQLFGEERHFLLCLRQETVDISSPDPVKTVQSSAHEGDIPALLAYTEMEEQCRIRRWSRLPLQNAAHEKALTIADEYSLPALELKPAAGEDKSENVQILGPRPCPLIRQGLDRMQIMQHLPIGTKDAAASLSCRQVSSRAAAIRQLQEQEKNR